MYGDKDGDDEVAVEMEMGMEIGMGMEMGMEMEMEIGLGMGIGHYPSTISKSQTFYGNSKTRRADDVMECQYTSRSTRVHRRLQYH